MKKVNKLKEGFIIIIDNNEYEVIAVNESRAFCVLYSVIKNKKFNSQDDKLNYCRMLSANYIISISPNSEVFIKNN